MHLWWYRLVGTTETWIYLLNHQCSTRGNDKYEILIYQLVKEKGFMLLLTILRSLEATLILSMISFSVVTFWNIGTNKVDFQPIKMKIITGMWSNTRENCSPPIGEFGWRSSHLVFATPTRRWNYGSLGTGMCVPCMMQLMIIRPLYNVKVQ